MAQLHSPSVGSLRGSNVSMCYVPRVGRGRNVKLKGKILKARTSLALTRPQFVKVTKGCSAPLLVPCHGLLLITAKQHFAPCTVPSPCIWTAAKKAMQRQLWLMGLLILAIQDKVAQLDSTGKMASLRNRGALVVRAEEILSMKHQYLSVP